MQPALIQSTELVLWILDVKYYNNIVIMLALIHDGLGIVITSVCGCRLMYVVFFLS